MSSKLSQNLESLAVLKVVTIIGLGCLACATTSPPDLLIEPVAGNTVSFGRMMMTGEELVISSTGLKEGEIFRMHLCGPKCDSASPFKIYPHSVFSTSWRDTVSMEKGEYYFWLENVIGKTEKYGQVVKPIGVEWRKDIYTITFESGSTVEISLNK